MKVRNKKKRRREMIDVLGSKTMERGNLEMETLEKIAREK